jgi:hypothetical protein
LIPAEGAKALEQAPARRNKEMLVVMTALVFIEQHALLSRAQLTDAKRSIQALFIRATGEETMLRKLVDILRINRDLHHAFSAISKISVRISTSVEIISKKINYLKNYIMRLNLTPEESANFFSPFLSFTHSFHEKITSFNDRMQTLLDLKEMEARRLHEFRIAHDASERLRQRLSGKLGAEIRGEVETNLRQEVLETFDYAESQENLREAQRKSRQMSDEIAVLLASLKDMCQMAMNPDMRDQSKQPSLNAQPEDDVFTRFMSALRRYPRLRKIKDFILDYFKLYQRAYGMFILDYNNFNRAVETIANNPDEYFDAKQEDEDIRVKMEKLKKIEGLIPFLDTMAESMSQDDRNTFQQFSRHMSEGISAAPSKWEHIREDLLVAKVSAEADLSTRV